MFESPATRRSGGIVILWHEDQVNIIGVRQTFQELHVVVEVLPNNHLWLMSISYDKPTLIHRNTLSNNLRYIKDNYDGP